MLCRDARPGAVVEIHLLVCDAHGHPIEAGPAYDAVLSGAMRARVPLVWDDDLRENVGRATLDSTAAGALQCEVVIRGQTVEPPGCLFVAEAVPAARFTESMPRTMSGLLTQRSDAQTQRSRPLSAFSRISLRSVTSRGTSLMDSRLLTSRT
jgi:hypothetical protein